MDSIEATPETTLMLFTKTDGSREMTGKFDIIDGKFDYQGELPVTEAAKMLVEVIADNCGEWWIERAAKKPSAS